MAFNLPTHVSEAYNAARADFDLRKAVFANLDNDDLIASAKFWMAHCDKPAKFDKGSAVYDATFYHLIVPELLRRLGDMEDMPL